MPSRASGAASWAVTAAVFAHLALTVPLACLLNVWTDEGYSLATTSGGALDALERALTFELQPPLYFVLLALWRRLDHGVAFARMLSIVCTSATVALSARLAVRYAPRLPGGCAAGVVALSPVTVWAAVEIRCYALVLLLTAMSMLLFHRAFLVPAPGRRDLLAYVVTAILALYTHYYLGLLLLAHAVALIALGRWRRAGLHLASMAPVAVALAPLLLLAPYHASVHAAGAEAGPSLDFALDLLRRVDNALFGWDRTLLPRAARLLLRLGVLVIVAAGAWRLARSPRNPAAPAPALAAVAAVLGLSFVAVQHVVGLELVTSRHTVALVLPALLLVLALVASAGGPRLAVLSALGWMLVEAVALAGEYGALAKPGDFRRVAAHIGRAEARGQPILVFPSSAALALGVHYRGVNSVAGLPQPASLERYDPRQFAIVSPSALRRGMAAQMRDSDRCWLVALPVDAAVGVPLNRGILDEVVGEDFVTEGEQSFHRGTSVKLLRRRTHR